MTKTKHHRLVVEIIDRRGWYRTTPLCHLLKDIIAEGLRRHEDRSYRGLIPPSVRAKSRVAGVKDYRRVVVAEKLKAKRKRRVS